MLYHTFSYCPVKNMQKQILNVNQVVWASLSSVMTHFKMCIYLFENWSYRKRGTSSLCWFASQMPGLGQTKVRGQELLLCLHIYFRAPSIWAIFYCFSQAFSEGLYGKRSRQNVAHKRQQHRRWVLSSLCHNENSVMNIKWKKT